MLKNLTIRNLAIIDTLELELGPGFTVLTGETGAGKSILIDALGLVAGMRADAGLVRAGQEKAEVTAAFELKSLDGVRDWLQGRELLDADEPDTLIVRRVVYAEGRTRAFVNGSAVNAGDLRELGERLIDVFGQSESQTLLRADVQRRQLDDYGRYPAALAAVREAAQEHAELSQRIERLQAAGARDPSQVEFLRFQLRELDALNVQAEELEKLETEHRRLANAGRLLQDGSDAQERLYGGDDSLYDQLAEISTTLDALLPMHEGFREAADLVGSAQAQVREARDSLRHLLERLDLDPERLAEVEQRLSAIHDLARKHRIKAAELPAHRERLGDQLDEIEQATSGLSQLQSQRDAAKARWATAAQRLGTERRKAGKRFADGVTAIVRQLGMPNARFLVAIEALADDAVRPHGADEIRFDFSANPGQPPRALAKVASGGELSRVSLALQVTALARGGAGTMIFDEVDAGISGGVAEIVGQQLRALGRQRQVLSVTHLAQVAAQGHAHLAIHKEVRGGATFTRVQTVADGARVAELARMQGGVQLTETALAHAQELLARAANAT
jgi:DNA repair protein RecN (Recombination protein N)